MALAVLLTCRLYFKRCFKTPLWVNVLFLATTVTIGMLTVTLHDQKRFRDHYTLLDGLSESTYATLQFKVREVLKSSRYHDKYVVDLITVNNNHVSGRLLLNIEKDSTKSKLEVDHVFVTNTKFEPLNTPLNPYQFNYERYLNKQYIYHQLYIKSDHLLAVQTRPTGIRGYASQLRKQINRQLQKYHFKENELAVINALLLGQRQDISKDLYNSYSQAGAIHILAVSGLHVGIILLLLNYLFKPLEYIKHGRSVKALIIVLLLWCFAVIAGLSASVVRAVTMFTVVAIAMNLKRPTNIYNTLTVSMFVLLLFKPLFLFDVGFQISYAAVFSIVTLQPMFYNLWIPKYKLLQFFWKLITVTLAAQLGILPLSLYYFHQFPGLFFLSNLVIIPFLGLILGIGLLVIILALLECLPAFLAISFERVIEAMNIFVNWVSKQEAFLFRNISFDLGHMVFSYLLLITFIAFLKQKKPRYVYMLLSVIIGFQGFLFYNKYKAATNQFIIFHKSRHTVIGIKEHRKLALYHSFEKDTLDSETFINNYKRGARIDSLKTIALQQDVFVFNNKILLSIDSLGVYNVSAFKPDIILLRNSPRVNLGRVIDSLQPELIISDGSNYKSYQKRWANTCVRKKIPFHQTDEKGAFIEIY